MKTIDPALFALLLRLDPAAGLVQRHLWLYDVLGWVRGDRRDVQAAVGRVRQVLAAVQQMPDWLPRWRAWWQNFITQIDLTPLLADFGFAPRTAFLSEAAHRLRRKWVPATPETTDLAQLFNLLLPHAFDAQWLRALDPQLTSQLRELLFAPVASAPQDVHDEDPPAAALFPVGDGHPSGTAGDAPATAAERPAANSSAAPAAVALEQMLHTTSNAWRQPGLSYWQSSMVDAIIYNISQIGATGFANEIRLRMTHGVQTMRAFHDLPAALDTFVRALHLYGPHSEAAALQVQALRDQLQACRQAANTVYEHLDQHGVSVGIVFLLRQLRERIVRVNELLDCLLSRQPAQSTTRLIARLVMVGAERRSLRKLWQSSTHLTAAKVAERHAEAGEHYITRNAAEWRAMFAKALGGGATISFAVWFKFVIGTLALSIFWNGFAAGLNYAVFFVVIYLLHWTVATKQPAVTAPAMAAKLKDMNQPNAVDAFVDEVSHLIRSQIAAISGNIIGVVPAVLLICVVLFHFSGQTMLSMVYATKTLNSLHIAGPTLLFAAVTGVLLFASSLIAGWTENWFVFHQLDSSIAWHPRLRRLLGAERARRWGLWWRNHVSGLAANISLGFLLGLVPSFAQFFGIPLEVRHVTLVAGQIAAAAYTYGWPVVRENSFWLAVAAVVLVGPINLAVSFYLAFRTALAAHNVPRLDRRRINAALRYRLRHEPRSFFFPPAARARAAPAQPPAPMAPPSPAPTPPAAPPPLPASDDTPLH